MSRLKIGCLTSQLVVYRLSLSNLSAQTECSALFRYEPLVRIQFINYFRALSSFKKMAESRSTSQLCGCSIGFR